MDILKELVKQEINKIAPLDDEGVAKIVSIANRKNFEKGEVISQSGVIAKNIYFIISGLVRCYYITHEGKEYNQAFKRENEFVASYASLLTGDPAIISLECLEETHALVFPYQELKRLFDESHPIERVGRKIAEQHFMNKEKREYELLLHSATDRYLRFKERNPELVERVPQLHLASFLGVTQTSFNRLLKDLKK